MSIACLTTELLPSFWAFYAKTSSYVCNNVLRLVCCSRVRSVLFRLNAVCRSVCSSRVVSASMSDRSNSKIAISAVSGVNSPRRVRR